MKTKTLAIAASYLLRRLGDNVEPKELEEYFSHHVLTEDVTDVEIWESLLDFNKHLHLVDSGLYGTWPSSSNAIVKFQYQPPEQLYIEVNNIKRANIVDHYCVMDNVDDKTIIDSADGTIKEHKIYGLPSGWAVYELEEAPAEPAPAPKPPKPGTTYKVLSGGENAWQLAEKLKLGINGQDLMDHNGLDSSDIPGGTVLRLPIPLAATPEKPRILYDVLDSPRAMHVIRDEGTRKFAFGNVTDLKDLRLTGPTYRKDANVLIHAIAHVPIGDDTAEFYMESAAVGDYKNTGNMAFTIGFNHSHLADGHVENVKPTPKPQIEAKLKEAEIAQQAAAAPAPVENPAPPADPEVADKPINYDEWKTTFAPLNEAYQPKMYLFDEDMVVHDLDQRRPDVLAFKLKGVQIAGTFWKDGIQYGRPIRGKDSWHWYGIPMDKLTPEDELYDTSLPLEQRVGGRYGHLTTTERYVTVPLAKALAQRVRVKDLFDKIKQKI